MEKKGSILSALMALVIALSALTGSIEVHASNGTEIVVLPATNVFYESQAPPGTEITINITVKDVTDLWNWQIRLTWNGSLLDFVDIFLPSDHVFAASGYYMITPKVPVNGSGYVMWGCTYTNEPYWTFNGTGTLCQVKFRIRYPLASLPVTCELALVNVVFDTFLIDGSYHDIPFTVKNGIYRYEAEMFPVIRVPYDYSTIQAAINAAPNESIVLVSHGTYYEHLTIRKPLKLLGESKATTVLDGNKTGTVVDVTADNVYINGFTIKNASYGIYFGLAAGGMITDNLMTHVWDCGILVENSSGTSISDNIVAQCGIAESGWWSGCGIALLNSADNTIDRNVITDNVVWAFYSKSSNHNLIHHNVFANTQFTGLDLDGSGNIIHHNSFINNSEHIDSHSSQYGNIWDDGVEGNYWDSYGGLDDGSGDRVAGDGVGDTNLPFLGLDYYPLVSPHTLLPIVCENVTYLVGLSTRSQVTGFSFRQTDKKIMFNVRGTNSTSGNCTLEIPKMLLRGPWTIWLDNTDITTQASVIENETYTIIFFNYTHSSHNVQVIGTWVVPEFPSQIALATFMVATILLALVRKSRKLSKKIEHSRP